MKFKVDLDNVTYGELEDCAEDPKVMKELMIRFMADDNEVSIPHEEATKILRAMTAKDQIIAQVYFLECSRSAQMNAVASLYGQRDTK